MAKFYITLVHGTFARNARWTRPRSDFRLALRQHLVDKGHQVEFSEPLSWTGANRVFARRSAANTLAEKLLGHTDDHTGRVHVAIGHSHGGSAIAYALKAAPRLAQTLAGVVFLATPFIDVRAHVSWRLAARLLALLFFAAMWSAAFVAGILAIGLYYYDFGGAWLVWTALGLYSAVGLVGWLLEDFVTAKLTKFLERRIQRFIDDVSTSKLPDAPAYFLARAPADEAAAFLSFIQFVAWVTGRVFYAIASAANTVTQGLKRLWRSGLTGKLWLISVTAMLVAGYLVAITGVFIATTDRDLSAFQYIGPLDLLFYAATNPGIESWWLRVPVIAALLVWIALAIGAVVMFLATIVSVVTHLAFGTGWTAGPFVELAVEPVPRGEWCLHRTDWPEDSGPSHSDPYASAKAVALLAEWIANLAGPSENPK